MKFIQNILSDQSRILLGLKPVLSTWQTIQEEDRIYFFENNILYKAIYAFEDNGDDLIVEYDTNILLDNERIWYLNVERLSHCIEVM